MISPVLARTIPGLQHILDHGLAEVAEAIDANNTQPIEPNLAAPATLAGEPRSERTVPAASAATGPGGLNSTDLSGPVYEDDRDSDKGGRSSLSHAVSAAVTTVAAAIPTELTDRPRIPQSVSAASAEQGALSSFLLETRAGPNDDEDGDKAGGGRGAGLLVRAAGRMPGGLVGLPLTPALSLSERKSASLGPALDSQQSPFPPLALQYIRGNSGAFIPTPKLSCFLCVGRELR